MSIIDELELSVRASNVLRRMGGIETLEDFMALTRKQVTDQPHAGIRTWREVADVQAALRPESREAAQRRAWAEFQDAVGVVNRMMVDNPAYRTCNVELGLLVAVQSGPREAAARGEALNT